MILPGLRPLLGASHRGNNHNRRRDQVPTRLVTMVGVHPLTRTQAQARR